MMLLQSVALWHRKQIQQLTACKQQAWCASHGCIQGQHWHKNDADSNCMWGLSGLQLAVVHTSVLHQHAAYGRAWHVVAGFQDEDWGLHP